jgi:hypothetical protein
MDLYLLKLWCSGVKQHAVWWIDTNVSEQSDASGLKKRLVKIEAASFSEMCPHVKTTRLLIPKHNYHLILNIFHHENLKSHTILKPLQEVQVGRSPSRSGSLNTQR